MIKRLFFFAFTTGFVACGGNNTPTPVPVTGNDSAVHLDTTAAAPTSINKAISKEDYEAGLAMISKSDCVGCHKISDKVVGPAYQDIADKYSIDAKTIATLVDKVINGGSGNWGNIPMQPHATLSKDDAEKMVKYILALKKN